jgi:signal transduction histidine kinase
LLRDVSLALASANDGEPCISEAVSLAVPEFSDILVVDLVVGSELRRLAFKLDSRTGATLEDADTPEILEARAAVLDHGEPIQGWSFAVAPLFARGQVLGAVTAVMIAGGREILAADVAFLREIGRRMARLVDHEQLCNEAAAIVRTKEEFLATLSHELRTPLHAILGWSHMLQTGELDPPTRKQAFDAIERNARSQARLIEEMLDLSRALTGGLKLQLRNVELGAIASSVRESLRPMAGGKRIEVGVVIDRDVPAILGDPQRLRQIVWHLLSNAIKFTPLDGTIQLSVARAGEEVVLAVRDSGEGIPRAFLPHVFEHFSQGDGSSTRRHGGMGLGLAVVRHFTEMHGGTAIAESEGEHCGARFSVRFPVRAEIPKIASGALDGEDFAQLEPGVLRGLRVAVIDDEPDALAIVATVLGLCGAEVRTVRSSEDAALARFMPDVVVTSAALGDECCGALTIRLDKPIEPQALVSRITRVLFRAA